MLIVITAAVKTEKLGEAHVFHLKEDFKSTSSSENRIVETFLLVLLHVSKCSSGHKTLTHGKSDSDTDGDQHDVAFFNGLERMSGFRFQSGFLFCVCVFL